MRRLCEKRREVLSPKFLIPFKSSDAPPCKYNTAALAVRKGDGKEIRTKGREGRSPLTGLSFELRRSSGFRFSRSLSLDRTFGFRSFRRSRGEFELGFSVFENEKCGERPVLLGNEFMQQVGLAGGQKFDHLFARHVALQNDFAGTEIARFVRPDRFFANVGHASIVNVSPAFRAFPNGLQAREINRLCLAILTRARPGAEVKLRFELGVHLQHRSEWPAHLAFEALQRANLLLAQEFFSFFHFDLSASDDLPHGEIAVLTLVHFVVLF